MTKRDFWNNELWWVMHEYLRFELLRLQKLESGGPMCVKTEKIQRWKFWHIERDAGMIESEEYDDEYQTEEYYLCSDIDPLLDAAAIIPQPIRLTGEQKRKSADKTADEIQTRIKKALGLKKTDEVDCPYAKSDMTPCVARDGNLALMENGRCVGCNLSLKRIIEEHKGILGGLEYDGTDAI